jgi:MarR family
VREGSLPAPPPPLIKMLRRQPLIGFYVMAFAFTWIWDVLAFEVWHLDPLSGGLAPGPFLGPTLAAFVMTASIDGKRGVLRLLRRYVLWRVPIQWYVAVLLGMPALTLVSVLILPGAVSTSGAPSERVSIDFDDPPRGLECHAHKPRYFHYLGACLDWSRRLRGPADRFRCSPARSYLASPTRTRRIARSGDERVKQHELTKAQALLLRSLDAPMPMRQIALRLDCEPSNVMGIVDRLEARGLIRRVEDPADRRVKYLTVTTEGERVRA